MIISLKIFLSILIIAFGYISYFVISEFKKFKKSQEAENASLIEKFVLGAITFSCVSLLLILVGFCILLIISSITITLPW